MSRELLESILDGDYLTANELFEQRLADIQEKKMYEVKRMVACEELGGRTIAQAEKQMRARGLTPRKASDVLPDPRSSVITPEKKRKAAPTSVIKKPKDTRPGIIKRNINTLMGRSPSYVKPKTPESEKGGRLGTGIRMAGKGIGKAWDIWGSTLRSGMSGSLEEEQVKKPKKKILVTVKKDPRRKTGGGVIEIDKDKYNPKIHDLAVEE